MRQYEPVCEIPYLTLISEFLRDFRELHSRLDIIDRFGRDCLTDITDIPQNKSTATAAFLPEGSDKKVFQFKESDKRWGILDVIFREGRLANFRAQIFFQGWFAKSKAVKFNSLKLRPFMNEIFGTENVHYDLLNNTCYCSDGYGLMITFRYIPNTTSVSTTITEEPMHKSLSSRNLEAVS
jgi:hypothetical protein